MFEIEIGGKEVAGEVTFYTAQLYETEFGTDMLKDMLGKLSTADEGVVKTDGDGAVVSVDFTRVSWLTQLRVLWAALKTHDKTLPGFKRWSEKASGVDMWSVMSTLNDEVQDCFFRAAASDAE